MCGIVAALAFGPGLSGPGLADRMGTMAAAITHRGPDAAGAWSDAGAGVALGHRRLSIVDLSPAGAQPMASGSGRFTISFNGEIYNYEALRAQLPPQPWHGHSDTEVLLAAIEAFGVAGALARCTGMFAFALWDAFERELVIARDRMGEKPLYYGLARDALLIGSELKALEAWPGFAGDIDREALDDFMRRGCIHAPRSIYRNVRKLPAGSLLRVPASRARDALSAAPEHYWSLTEHAARPPRGVSADVALESLDTLLGGAIAGQMVADVPVGAFLSGGIDSSLVVALMQRQSSRPVRTYSIGFHEAGFNEAHHAKAVAAHLGTEHTELYVTAEEARAVIPRLPAMFDEPFGDSSQVPTFLVAELARRSVTVSLSGDGGDELFGGYNRYFWARRIWARAARVPGFMRRAAGGAVRSVGVDAWDRMGQVLPGRLRVPQLGDKLHKLAGLAALGDGRAAYDWLIAQYRGPERLVAGLPGAAPIAGHGLWGAKGRGLAEDMMLADAIGYLPDDILVKVDRATMAVGLEARAPFLDHRLVEFAFSLPLDLKIRGGAGKWLLRQLLYRHVPRELIERPKMGFGVPIDAWLRGPLKQWAGDLLAPDGLRTQGLLEPAPIARAWREHQSGRQNHQHFLWNALMFQAWLMARHAP